LQLRQRCRAHQCSFVNDAVHTNAVEPCPPLPSPPPSDTRLARFFPHV
jgi:hypothetical protein